MAYQNVHHRLAQGVYQIFNLASGTVMDACLRDRRAVKGYPVHGMLNQMWIVSPLGPGYSICNVLNGHYLTVEKGANEGAHIIATPYPVSWSLEPVYLECESWIIAWPNFPLVLDLHCGRSNPGETIHLQPRRHTEFCQRWRFVPCQSKFLSNLSAELVNSPAHPPTLAKENGFPMTDPSAQAGTKSTNSSPAMSTTETIVESEGSGFRDNGDLKITTTTTTVTTVTRRSTKPEDGKVYRIVNVKSGTVIDLNATDKASVIGHKPHDGSNQKWIFERRKSHWAFQSVYNGRYIGYDGQPKNGTRLIAVDHPFEWDIWPDEKDESTYRIFVHNGPAPGINFDLSNFGDPTSGTPVILYEKWEGENQTWRFEEV